MALAHFEKGGVSVDSIAFSIPALIVFLLIVAVSAFSLSALYKWWRKG
jgi:hypothetical protein